MRQAAERSRQILQTHAQLIHAVVQACHDTSLRPALEEYLGQAADDGWHGLVAAVRKILEGRRDPELLEGLDDEDRTIVSGILSALQDPTTLPDLDAQPDPAEAAPGLGYMIDLARRGDAYALQAIANMGEQMSRVGGDMARLAGTFRQLINGERDADKLSRGMGPKGKGLLLSIIEELGRRDTH